MRLLDSQDADGFHEKVDEAARLIEGLKKGSISPEYVDKVVCDRNDKENAQKLKKEKEEKAKELTPEKELELKGKVQMSMWLRSPFLMLACRLRTGN